MSALPFGIIGTSAIASRFAAAATGSGCMEPVAVCSRSRERGAAFAAAIGRPQAAVAVTPEELAAVPGLEAVYIASPNALHAAQAAVFLERGIAVLCEKTAAVTVEDDRRLRALAERHGTVYLEAMMSRFLPEWQAIQDALPRLGRISQVRLSFAQLSGRYPAYVRGEMPNIFNPALAAGALTDLGVYCVYPALGWFGKPLTTHTRAKRLRTGADGCGVSLWEYPDFLLELSWNKIASAGAPSEILGDAGTLTVGLISQLQPAVLREADGTETVLSRPRDHTAAMRFEAEAFCRFVRGEDGDGYRRAAALQTAVCEHLCAMRADADIVFPAR